MALPTTGWYKNSAGQMVNGPMPTNVYQDTSVAGGGGWVEGVNPNPPAAQAYDPNGLSLGGPMGPSVMPGQTQWNQPTQYWTDPQVATGNFVPGQNKYPNQAQQYDQSALDYFYMLNNPGWKPGAPTGPPTGLIGSEQALNDYLAQATAAAQQGVAGATAAVQPYTQAGGAAIKLQADLSGANGPEAQRAAFAQYNESPEVAYQREQAEKSVTRNASATGGLKGGGVLQELQRQAVGLAQQDYGNYYGRLGDISGIGSSAARDLANINADTGRAVADYNYGTGQAVATGRTNAGNAIADNVANTTSALAKLVADQGGDLSDIINAGGADLANLLSTFGSADAQTLQDLAKILANISTGSATQFTGLPQLPAGNTLGQYGQLLEGAGTAYGAYQSAGATG